MKGDFSHWQFDPSENFNGVLQQQGRVLLDRDWNEQSRIQQHWQDQSGRDVIGSGIAAVPSNTPDGFRVVQAEVTGAAPNQQVELLVLPGRIWADGLLCYLPGVPPNPAAPVTRVADYLQQPIDDTPGTVDSIDPGVRDAVVLEVSREELNAFQVPERLLEAALGGPDTTERVHLRTAFRLYRLGPGEDCHDIGDDLRDDPAEKGRLTVQLQPTVNVPGDCPVVVGGGYTGFEHHLYRVEIAAQDAAQPASFKWSQFNGGLVGRGRLIAAPNRISITANQAAILNAGLSDFYCEVLEFDVQRGVWQTTFGADVTLNGTDLTVGTIRLGVFSAASETVFFRLWNGIEPIAEFSGANPVELIDGIQLQFDPASATNYTPGDFWNFPVRAGEVSNPEVLIDDQIRFGPLYHRVPLAEITWGADGVPVVPPQIEDCRHRFRPLTQLDTCCTVRVGDGHHSHGDFTSIQEAVDALPAAGGMVCILPGEYEEAITLANRQNITLSGCGPRTRLLAPANANGFDAVITVWGGSGITIECLAVEASPNGRGIFALGRNFLSQAEQIPLTLIDGLVLKELSITSSRTAAVRVEYAVHVTLLDCGVHQHDVVSFEHAVVFQADDVRIEHNLIEVALEQGPIFLTAAGVAPDTFLPGSFNLGGLHLKSLCERVRVIDNEIRGGSGNGITLGSILWFFEDGDPVPPDDVPPEPDPDPCDPTRPLDGLIDPGDFTIGEGIIIRRAPGGPLYSVRIERNRIHSMGANGIGVAGFFDLSQVDEFISVIGLEILGNEIRECLRRSIAPAPASLAGFIGYGGISLADVEHLVVHDNVIVDNGPSALDPVCGVFVVHGEGIDLHRNRILNNGAATGEPPSAARAGQRGGVVVRYAFPPTVPLLGTTGAPIQNGVPAFRLQDNIVSTPLGRALVVAGVGPMSVQGNQLTTRGVVPRQVDTSSFLAATVQITNLGLSNELYLQLLQFNALTTNTPGAYLTAALANGVSAGRPGIDDAVLGRILANGQVMFSDNQVNLDLLARGLSVALTSTLIMTLDDIAFHDNQCEANLLDDFLLAHSLTLAFSQRVDGNRWKEGFYNAYLSALTLSFFMNTTTDNQGTHCIVVRGLPTRIVDDHNIVLLQGVLGESDGLCDRFRRFMPNLAKNQS